MLANILRSGDNGEDCCKNVDFSYETEEYRTLLSLKRVILRNDGSFITNSVLIR